MRYLEINQAILDVLCRDGYFACYTNIKQYPIGTKFFRVKRLKCTKIPDSGFRTYNDYWETKPEYLKEYGRLNKPRETLFYVCTDLHCTIKEVHFEECEFFCSDKVYCKK